MKGVCICKKCIQDIKNGTPIPNLDKYDPDNTLRDILKYCAPHMNLHTLKNLCLCSPCIEILKSLEDHVKRYTNLEDIHHGRIPEDIGDFVNYCMSSFTISSNSQSTYRKNKKKSAVKQKVNNSPILKLNKIKKSAKERMKKSRRQMRILKSRVLKRSISSISVLDSSSQKQKIPMICNHYLNSMLEKSNISQKEKSPSNYSDLFLK